jgi:hypothetical protein
MLICFLLRQLASNVNQKAVKFNARADENAAKSRVSWGVLYWTTAGLLPIAAQCPFAALYPIAALCLIAALYLIAALCAFATVQPTGTALNFATTAIRYAPMGFPQWSR